MSRCRWHGASLVVLTLALLVQCTGAAITCDSQQTHGQAYALSLQPECITGAVSKLLGWQIPFLQEDAAALLPPDASDRAKAQMRNRRSWIWGAMLIGMADWATTSSNDTLWEWLQGLAEEEGYKLGDRIYHADDHAVGQMYYALHTVRGIPYETAIAPTQEQFDYILENPAEVSLDHRIKGSKEDAEEGYRTRCQRRWCWCDALFMAPPTWHALTLTSGNLEYSDFADDEFWASHDYLFRSITEQAPGAGLFLRDSRFFKLDETGKLVFWGRGNGWVYAGITSILKLIPDDHPSRGRYEALFLQMSRALVMVQVQTGPHTGFWSPSLLAYPEHPYPESSCTGFFVSGLAWGVRTGLLPAHTYLPAAQRGWEALLSAQQDDGRIGWTQQIGAEPDSVVEGETQLYSSGAFLKAASELLQLTCDDGGDGQPGATSGASDAGSAESPPAVAEDAADVQSAASSGSRTGMSHAQLALGAAVAAAVAAGLAVAAGADSSCSRW